MATKIYNYICQSCGATYSKWVGKCADCNSWNTVELQQATCESYTPIKNKGTRVDFLDLSHKSVAPARVKSNIGELDQVLGGGMVPGSAILIGGDPGIGKSTLLLQLVTKLANKSINSVYISGEESIEQIKLHATRLGLEKSPVRILTTTNINDIVTTVESEREKIELIVIDSIQTMFIPDIPSSPGTVTQVRSTTHELITLAKKKNITIMLIGHVTKDGQIAGPKILEHMVDTVLYFEGEKSSNFRVLRSVKNRFGSINEIGIFEMTEQGLAEVNNPSSLFLSERKINVSGSTIFANMEGSRPVLVEIQALVSHSHMASPRRAVVGWDLNRLSMMIAVLASRYGLNLNSHEVYLNVVGGLKIIEPAADLAVMCSLISALHNKALNKDMIVFGEVGLSGEVRKISNINARLKESEKLGFKSAIVPLDSKITDKKILENMKIVEVGHVKQLKSFFSETTCA